MRIRTIKPEFYRSADIADLCIEDRLLFIGVWSYVDDNGVGRDEEDLVVTDLFAKDYFKDPVATLARVSTGLARLADAGLVVRYKVEGRSYLQVTNWGRHQKIDRPNKPRYPRSDADGAEIAATLASVATNPSWGAEDQRIRGSEDQSSTSGTADAAPRPDVDSLCSLLADLIEANGSKRPNVTKRWKDAARLMLDTDERALAEAEGVIRWSQSDEFWKTNILSMPKLREKYDQLRLRMGASTPAAMAPKPEWMKYV